jgi:cobalt-zinc-cadmium efflux system outer membrane protein
VARVEAQVAADVASAWSDFAAAAELAQRMEGGLLERAARARDLVEVQYRKGAASLLDYLDAQRTFTGTRVEYLNDLASYWTAFFRLEQAVGEELR